MARGAHKAVKRAYERGLSKSDPEAYGDLLKKFRAMTGAARYDLDSADIAGRGKDIDCVIIFLAADPYFFRSGYFKSFLLRRLKKATLADDQKRALAVLVLLRVTEPRRSNRHDYGRLAAALAWPPLDDALIGLAAGGQLETQQRACEMICRIISRRPVTANGTQQTAEIDVRSTSP